MTRPLLLALLIVAWFVWYVSQPKSAPVPPVARPVVEDSTMLTYRISDSVSIQVSLIPHGKGVNVLILPVTKSRRMPGKGAK